MLETATKYQNLLSKRGQEDKPVKRLFRIISNPEMLRQAYVNLYANKGAMTEGTNANDSIDGMSFEKIERLSQRLKAGKFKWEPVRRIHIPKAKGKTRPLGIPNWSEKLVQESMRIALTAYYEPKFKDASHGFRPKRGCHTALNKINHTWTGTKWFIEGDIKGCFDNINHEKLMAIIEKDIYDDRFSKLLKEMLKAGYLENWMYKASYTGTPQGGIVSPLLANIYLNEFDTFIEEVILPRYNFGKVRRCNPAYSKVVNARKLGNITKVEAKKAMAFIPSKLTHDPDYKRLKYIRYADDFLLSVIGSKQDAENIKDEIKTFLLNELGLELSEEKTLITHAQTDFARFLGYDIGIIPDRNILKRDKNGVLRRANGGKIQLRIPAETLRKHVLIYIDFKPADFKSKHISTLLQYSDYEIVRDYAVKFRGLYEYFSMATNVKWLHKLQNYMRYSLVKTLANKHKTSSAKIHKKLRSRGKTVTVVVKRENKPDLKASFGNFRCERKTLGNNVERVTQVFPKNYELLERMQLERCELCGSNDTIQVHHIQKLANLKNRWTGGKEKPQWVQLMIKKHRKTLVVCLNCHTEIHAGSYDGKKLNAF